MTGGNDARNMALEMAQALALLRAGRGLYTDILDALRETVDARGEADIPVLVRRLNEALTAYAPRDTEVRALLSRYE